MTMRMSSVIAAAVAVILLSPPAARSDDSAPQVQGPTTLIDTGVTLAPVIVEGRLADDRGEPISGQVELLAWPDDVDVDVGDVVTLEPVARAIAASDGSFALRAHQTPKLASMAAANGGHLNLTLRTLAGGRRYERFLSRYYSDGPGPLNVSVAGRGPAWLARPDEAAEALDVQLPIVAAGPTELPATPVYAECYDSYQLLERRNSVNTVIGELHTEDDTVAASFLYGEQADSDIGVAMKQERGPWKLSGEHHVGNSSGSVAGKGHAGRNYNALLYTTFDYGRYRVRGNCVWGHTEVVRAIEWRPGGYEHFYSQPGCREDSPFVSRYPERWVFERKKERSVTWGGAVEVFGASLSARSGYSRHVRARWEFGDKPVHLLCGDDGNVNNSSRIFAGSPGFALPCQPGRPC